MPGPTGRSEKRTARKIAVELSRLGELMLHERTFTKNVSPRGARVITEQEWQLETRLLLISRKDGVQLQAHVVYRQRLAKDSRRSYGLLSVICAVKIRDAGENDY